VKDGQLDSIEPSQIKKVTKDKLKDAPSPKPKTEELDIKKLEAKVDDAWASRLDLVQLILDHEPDKNEDMPDDIFEKIGRLTAAKEELERILPAIKKAAKNDPEGQSNNYETVKNTIEGDEQIINTINDYLAYIDKDAVKYDLARIMQSKLDYNITDVVELPDDQLEAIAEKPVMTYQEFKKSKDQDKSPKPIEEPYMEELPTLPKAHIKKGTVGVIKEDSFEYAMTENDNNEDVYSKDGGRLGDSFSDKKHGPKYVDSHRVTSEVKRNPYRDDGDAETKRLLGLIDKEMQASSLKRKQMEDDFDEDLDYRASKLREDRKNRQLVESKLMADRESQIASLVASTTTKTRLLPTQEQSSNIHSFAKAQVLGHEVQSKYAKITDKIKHISKLKGEIDIEDKRVSERYAIKDDIAVSRVQSNNDLHGLKQEKEELQRKLDRKVDEVRQQRIAVGGGNAKTRVDEQVEKELRGIDHLMMVKLLELRREKAKLEDLKSQYEEYVLGDEQKRTDFNRKDENAISQLPVSSMLLPLVTQEIQKSNLGSSALSISTMPTQLRSHPMPAVQSELIETPGSKFLDDFNRDLNRLICRDY
jgi:hypothetical protein